MIEVSVPLPAPGEEPLLVDALRRAGALEVKRDGARFLALFPSSDPPEAVLGRVRAAVRASTSIDDPAPAWRWEDAGGWAGRWSRDFAPRQVTPRIRVTGPSAFEPSTDSPITIRLEPGLGFGTASHPTTRACLRLVESRLRPGDRVADVGAGSGILAVAAALLGARRVLAIEVDPHACASLRANIAANGVGRRVRVREGAVGARGPARLRRFHGIAANIEAERLLPLVPGLARSLARGGWLVLGGATAPDRAPVLEAAQAAGLSLLEQAWDEGWWAGAFSVRRRSAIRARSGDG